MHFFKDEEQHKSVPLTTPIQHCTKSQTVQYGKMKDILE